MTQQLQRHERKRNAKATYKRELFPYKKNIVRVTLHNYANIWLIFSASVRMTYKEIFSRNRVENEA